MTKPPRARRGRPGREPLAWHGGVRVLPGGNGKWILQKFKELEAGCAVAVSRSAQNDAR